MCLKDPGHRVIMCQIETKTICCHPQFGQFYVHIRIWGGARYSCRFCLAVFNAVLTDITTINKYSNNVQQLTFFT